MELERGRKGNEVQRTQASYRGLSRNIARVEAKGNGVGTVHCRGGRN